MASFWKPEASGQTVLPDRSVLIGQKLVENVKIQMGHFEWFSNNDTQSVDILLPNAMIKVTTAQAKNSNY